jgi:heme/copper-type cytochrome/quinol oxidase subunit 2
MNQTRTIKIVLVGAAAAVALFVLSSPALAQCALCKNAITGSPEAARLSQSLNFAILILLIPPVLIFCGIFVLAYRYRKARGTEPEPPDKDGERRNWFTASGAHRKRKDRSEHEAGGAPA